MDFQVKIQTFCLLNMDFQGKIVKKASGICRSFGFVCIRIISLTSWGKGTIHLELPIDLLPKNLILHDSVLKWRSFVHVDSDYFHLQPLFD